MKRKKSLELFQRAAVFGLLLYLTNWNYSFYGIPYYMRCMLQICKISCFLVEFDSDIGVISVLKKRKSQLLDLLKSNLPPILLKARADGSRLHHLDSCRGIAAFYVLIGHTVSIQFMENDYVEYLKNSSYSQFLFLSGGHCVQLFLVLSGYVLAMVYWKENRCNDIRKMLIGRVTRLYPVHWIMLIFAIPIVNYYAIVFDHDRKGDATSEGVAECILLVQSWYFYYREKGPFYEYSCNSVAWSLSVEWLINIIFFFLIRYLPVYFCLAIIEAFAFLTFSTVLPGSNLGESHLANLSFAFCIGVLLYKYSNWAKITSIWMQLCFDVALLYHIFQISTWFSIATESGIGNMMTAIWGCIFIYLVENSFVFKYVLSLRPFVLLGEISFSLYLSHVVILRGYRIFIAYGNPKIGNAFEFLFFIFAALSVAFFVNKKLEIPIKSHMDISFGISGPKRKKDKEYVVLTSVEVSKSVNIADKSMKKNDYEILIDKDQ